MKLSQAALWADNTLLYDAYDPSVLALKAQVSSYIDNQLDGAISKRRVISFAPGLNPPARRVAIWGGETWIIGDQLQDFWKGKPLRVSAATKRATGLYTINTPAQAVNAAGGTEAFCQMVYYKDTVDPITTSQYTPQYQLFFSSVEDVKPGYVVVTNDQRYLHVRSAYPILDGFVCAEADELGFNARNTVTHYALGEYNVAADAKEETAEEVNALVLDYFQLYGRETALAYGQAPGDLTFIVASAPAAGERYMLDGLVYNVLGVKTNMDGFTLHMRRR